MDPSGLRQQEQGYALPQLFNTPNKLTKRVDSRSARITPVSRTPLSQRGTNRDDTTMDKHSFTRNLDYCTYAVCNVTENRPGEHNTCGGTSLQHRILLFLGLHGAIKQAYRVRSSKQCCYQAREHHNPIDYATKPK